ncbi:Qat anti-phage system TatD family nuclease QatD [Sulfuricaulis sp.]|uniref:Qat anti-phage system TatD family nuclease QatD n=1 Tax=Sulfuricaulis sp. TaxID=2003553 RepID=UPI00345D6305
MIDFHCHLDLYPHPDSVLARVVREKVYVLAVTTTPLAWSGTRRLVGDAPRVRVALGLHPQVVAERHAEIDLLCSLVPETPYIGEIGLDGSESCAASFGLQQKILEKALSACTVHGGRIISLHSRRASREVLDAIEKYPNCGTPVLHWFSGSLKELKRAIQLGCWFSVGPAMLQSERGSRLAAAMPRERLLTETDGPFAKTSSGPLMPWNAKDAERELAKLWGCREEIVNSTLNANLRRLVAPSETAPTSAD